MMNKNSLFIRACILIRYGVLITDGAVDASKLMGEAAEVQVIEQEGSHTEVDTSCIIIGDDLHLGEELGRIGDTAHHAVVGNTFLAGMRITHGG